MSLYLGDPSQILSIDCLKYGEDVENKFFTKDFLWKEDTIDGLEINLGFKDGILDKYDGIKLDDNIVHGIIGGMTGSGKSNLLNCIIASLIQRYSPRWAKLILLDLKNVEFGFYTNKNSLPHTELVAGTSDPDYCKSVFDEIKKSMISMKSLFVYWNCKKISEFNRKVLNNEIPTKLNISEFVKKNKNNKELMNKLAYAINNNKYIEEDVIPRKLIIIDEYQVIFNEFKLEYINYIKEVITSIVKLGRAFGIHMLLAAQSSAKTLGKDIFANFMFRFCLRATTEVSNEVLGNDAPICLMGQGYGFSNTSGGEDEKYNLLWKIPFISTDELTHIIEKVQKLNINNNTTIQRYFDDNLLNDFSTLKKYLMLRNENKLILGEPCVYTHKEYLEVNDHRIITIETDTEEEELLLLEMLLLQINIDKCITSNENTINLVNKYNITCTKDIDINPSDNSLIIDCREDIDVLNIKAQKIIILTHNGEYSKMLNKQITALRLISSYKGTFENIVTGYNRAVYKYKYEQCKFKIYVKDDDYNIENADEVIERFLSEKTNSN